MIRLWGVAFAVAVALASCARPPSPPAEPDEPAGAIVVERVAPGSPLGRAGLTAGDVLVRWTRGERGGRFLGFDDLAEVELEEAPRGAVRLVVARAGTERALAEVREDRWRTTVRPALSRAGRALHAAALRHERADEQDAAAAALARLAETESSPATHLWIAWHRAVLAGGSADAWEAALTAARAAGDRGLEAWLELERLPDLARAGDGEAAEAAGRRAFALRSELGQELAAIEARYRLAWLAGRRGEPAEEERRFRAVLDDLERLAPDTAARSRALRGLAKARATQGDFDEAFAHARAALELAERTAPGGLDHQAAHMSLGIFHWFVQDWDLAEASLARALELLERIDPENEDVANVLNNLGLVAAGRGDLVAAEGHYRRALELRRRIAPDPLAESRTLNNLGSIARARGDLAAAIAYDRQVLASRERLDPGALDTATPLLNLGENLVDAGQHDEAEPMLARALELFRRHAPASEDVARTLSVLGELARRRGDAAQAERLLAEALAEARRSAPATTLEAEVERLLAEARRELGDVAAAEALLRSSAARLDGLVPGTLAQALSHHALGLVLRDLGRHQEAKGELRAAAAALDRQFGLLGGTDEVRARYRASWRHVYRDLADLLLEQGDRDGAFEVLERARARAFLLMLRAREVEVVRSIPDELRRRRDEIATAYDELQDAIAERSAAGDHADVRRLALRRRELQRQRDQLGEQVARALPKLGALTTTLDPHHAATALGREVVAVAYTVEAEQSRAWIIGQRSGLRVVDLGVGADELHDLVDRFRLLLETPAPQSEPRPLGRRLYELLIAPAEAELGAVERIIVVPDGPLHHLPFAALVHQDTRGRERFLVEEKSIQVVASLTAWAELRGRRAALARGLVAFADPAPLTASGARARLRGKHLAALPGSRGEAEAIAMLFEPGAARVLAGAEATEPAAKRLGREARILHFATHAVVDPDSPLDSALLLAPAAAPSGRRENGWLQAWEVMLELPLEAELVTLSACESAAGTLVADEGILGLTRAFQLAGARAVLASLWKVADRETAELMTDFYRDLVAGLPADEALRAAQIAALSRPGGHPAHWAAFQLFGAAGDATASPRE